MHRSVNIKSILTGGALALAAPMFASADVNAVDVAAKAVEPDRVAAALARQSGAEQSGDEDRGLHR